MENAKNSSVQNQSEILAQLLRENLKILLLPSGARGRKDSNYEPDLDCAQPESAFCLSKLGVAVSDGCKEVQLFTRQGNLLALVPASRGWVPGEAKRLLDQLIENLEGHPTREVTMDFAGWLHAQKAVSMGAVIEYFLANADSWLIGLPNGTTSRRLFTEPPIKSGAETGTEWYRLVDLRMEAHLALT